MSENADAGAPDAAEEYEVPTSAQLMDMDHIVLVLHPDGRMDIARERTGTTAGSPGKNPSQTDYRYRNHLKVLVYGTLTDFASGNPKSVASVLDM